MRKYFILLVLAYLRFFARKALARHRPTIIGIAGSVGKSSTAHALFAVLKLHGPAKLIGNSETGIPLGILGLQPTTYTLFDWLRLLISAPNGIDHLKGTTYLIAEMGIDDPYPPKNMGYLLTILKPDIAIVLNESATHSMQFEKVISDKQKVTSTPEELLQIVTKKIAEEDCKIITDSGCKTAIYNADDSNISLAMKQYNNSNNGASLLSFGHDKSNTTSYKNYQVNLNGTSFSFSLTMKPSFAEASKGKQFNNETIKVAFSDFILPQEYQQTFAAAILAALQTGLTPEQIADSLEKNFTLPKGRASTLKGIHNTVIIDSSYNSSKAAVFAFLDMVQVLKKQTKRPIVFLMGDMRELGEEAKIEHEAVAEKLVGIVDYLYCVGPLTREHVIGNLKLEIGNWKFQEIRWFDNAKRAGEFLKNHVPANAIILVKGSQNTIFLEEAIKYILADKKDASKLCRQSDFWMRTKSK